MKGFRILYIIAIAALVAACGPETDLGFNVETGFEDGKILAGPAGGVHTVKVTATGDWVVITEEPWITVSPANGRGVAECQVSIDSTLLNSQRTGAVPVSYTHLTLPTILLV